MSSAICRLSKTASSISASARSTRRSGCHSSKQIAITVVRTAAVTGHRTPDRPVEYMQAGAARGLRVIQAGAGGTGHLPGMSTAGDWCTIQRELTRWDPLYLSGWRSTAEEM
jgi:hypothetical protein